VAEVTYWDRPVHRAKQLGRRERNRAAGNCINENNQGTHGPATHGVRCLRCYQVHKHGAVVAQRMRESAQP
jgi:hypothetical protein